MLPPLIYPKHTALTETPRGGARAWEAQWCAHVPRAVEAVDRSALPLQVGSWWITQFEVQAAPCACLEGRKLEKRHSQSSPPWPLAGLEGLRRRSTPRASISSWMALRREAPSPGQVGACLSPGLSGRLTSALRQSCPASQTITPPAPARTASRTLARMVETPLNARVPPASWSGKVSWPWEGEGERFGTRSGSGGTGGGGGGCLREGLPPVGLEDVLVALPAAVAQGPAVEGEAQGEALRESCGFGLGEGRAAEGEGAVTVPGVGVIGHGVEEVGTVLGVEEAMVREQHLLAAVWVVGQGNGIGVPAGVACRLRQALPPCKGCPRLLHEGRQPRVIGMDVFPGKVSCPEAVAGVPECSGALAESFGREKGGAAALGR